MPKLAQLELISGTVDAECKPVPFGAVESAGSVSYSNAAASGCACAARQQGHCGRHLPGGSFYPEGGQTQRWVIQSRSGVFRVNDNMDVSTRFVGTRRWWR